MTPAPALRLVTAALGLLALTARPAAPSWMTPPAPYRAKDFALVKHDGEFHVFYIRRNNELPFEQTEVDLGHAKSKDLYVWQHLPPVLAVRDSAWDDDHVWAPSIVQRDGVWFMFYTGVTDRPQGPRLWQRTGIATSTDLMTWNRMDEPVMTCLEVPWMLCDSLNGAMAFRDPSVIPDPAVPGRWLMVYSAFPDSDPGSMVAGIAASDGDFETWTDHGPLWISHRPVTGNGLVESPCLFERDGIYYLFFTTSHQQQIRFASTADPLGPTAGWTYRGALSTMIGDDTAAWFTTEYLKDGLIEYFGFVNGDRVDVREMKWDPDGTFTLEQPDVFHVVRMLWSADSLRLGDTLVLRIESVNGFGRPLPCEIFRIEPDGTENRLEPWELGVSNPPSVYGPTTEWKWIPTQFPDTLADGTLPRVVVRTSDRTCASPSLALRPGGSLPPVKSRGGMGGRILQPGGIPNLRPLTIHDFGAQRFLVELAAETPARLEVFDLAGRRVRTLADRTLGAGAHVIGWDGRDHAGRALPRGLYFARLALPDQPPRASRFLLR